jgi:predicted acylesterase/phospholipase RssA
LIDGAISCPIPIEILSKLGAEKIIAVNLYSLVKCENEYIYANSDYVDDIDFKEHVDKKNVLENHYDKKIPGVYNLLEHVIKVLENNNSLLTINENKIDVLIEPSLQHLKILDFLNCRIALEEGEKACLKCEKEKKFSKLKKKIKY